MTLVHKGNIMKYTEGAFRDWGYELARTEFAELTVSEDDVEKKFGGKVPAGKILIKDRIADSMFQQVQLRPDEYSVVATPNLNGDYLSDALAAQVGGIGIAPGANINYISGHGVFEATHGTAPKYADQDKVNPGSVILSGVLGPAIAIRLASGREAAADYVFRRIADVMAFEKWKAGLPKTDIGFQLAGALGKLRYGRKPPPRAPEPPPSV